MRAYTAKSGATQFMQALEDLLEADGNNDGFCLACGEIQSGVEPDARKYKCAACGAHKVYGASELALLGIVY